jgi:hypothetical protein
MNWLIVIGEGKAAEWVVKERMMAFRDKVFVGRVSEGDRFGLYITRGAFHNPSRHQAQIVALGRIGSEVRSQPVTVAGEKFTRVCDLSVEAELPFQEGLNVRPLVKDLDFIKNKKSWSTYVWRTLVNVPDPDFRKIEKAFGRLASERKS